MRPNWDEYFIGLAYAVSARASCPKLQVGAVLVDSNKRIVSTGYNGAPSGQPHCIEEGCVEVGNRCKRSVHAEENCLLLAPTGSLEGHTLYLTDGPPCRSCAAIVAGSGIKRIVYDREYTKDMDFVLKLLGHFDIVCLSLARSSMAEQRAVNSEVVGSSPTVPV